MPIVDHNEFRQNMRHAQGWWDDCPNTKMVQPGGAAPTWNTTYGGWDFPGNVDRNIWFISQMSHEKVLGSSVVPHVHWQPTTTNVNTVEWDIKYWYLNPVSGGAQNAAGTTETITVTPNGTAYQMQIDGFTAVSAPASESVSAFFIAEITRTGTTDANNDTVILKDFDPHAQKDQLGSISATKKWG
jgi:hypothetical protein